MTFRPQAEISLCLKCIQAIAPELGRVLRPLRGSPAGRTRPGRTLPGMQGFFAEIRRRLSVGPLSRGLAGTGAEDETPFRRSPFADGRPAAGPAVGRKTGRVSCRCRAADPHALGQATPPRRQQSGASGRLPGEKVGGAGGAHAWSVAVILVLRKTCCRASDSAMSATLSASAGRTGDDGRTRVCCWSMISSPRAQRAAKSRDC